MDRPEGLDTNEVQHPGSRPAQVRTPGCDVPDQAGLVISLATPLGTDLDLDPAFGEYVYPVDEVLDCRNAVGIPIAVGQDEQDRSDGHS